MKTKFPPSLAAVVAVASAVNLAIAQSQGEHPAVLVARTWSSRGIDPNTFIVLPPAGVRWISESPTTTDKAKRDPAPRAVKTARASRK